MKKVLITGASSGIGLSLATKYAKENWQVVACGRNLNALNELKKNVKNIEVLNFDVSDKEKTFTALSSLKNEFDLIILNAGTCEYVERGKIDTKLFRRVFETNFFGVLHCIEALQEQFSNKTHLALMGSTAAYLPFPRSEAYGASKSAIGYLANSLAADLQTQGVTVSLISPGFVQTPLTNKNDFPMPMIVSTEEAAEAIYKGLNNKKPEVHFPKKFTYILKFISSLPISLQRKMMQKISRKNE